jgi:hypothetical protein
VAALDLPLFGYHRDYKETIFIEITMLLVEEGATNPIF